MDKPNSSKMIIFRQANHGLEVFMINKKGDDKTWTLPEGTQSLPAALATQLKDPDVRLIELEPQTDIEDGLMQQAWAVEADWHDIPSLKGLLTRDLVYMKDQIKQVLPDMMERGTFVALKDAFKRVLPHQYEMLKELKDIISDRNLTKYM